MRNRSIIISAVLILGIFTSFAFSQTVQNTKNSADQSLRSNGRVNPSSLGMEMDIPLGSYPGRGINLPLGLSYSSKLWRFEEHSSLLLNNGNTNVYVQAKYSEDAASGWTSSLSQPYIEYTGDLIRFDDYGRPLQEIYGPGNSPPGDNYIRRITVYLPGGGSHELRAEDAPIHIGYGQAPPASAWEGDFYATDGSSLKYVQDTSVYPAIYKLYMPDGSFYTFNPTLETKSNTVSSDVRRAARLTDINGNFVQFNAATTIYPNGSWTDQLGRTFPVMIPRETPTMPVNQSVLEQSFILPGMSQGYTLRWKLLQDGFTPGQNYQLNYTGRTNIDQTISYLPGLFYDTTQMSPCSQDKLVVFVNSPEKFNPVVLTEVVLPNGASYRFSYNEFGEIERIHYPTGGREEITYDKVASLAELSKPYQMSNRGVVNRKIYESSSDATADTWTYTAASSLNNFRTSTIAPDGTQTDRFMHRGLPPPPCSNQTLPGTAENAYGTHWGYDNVLAGMPYEERFFSSDGQLKQRTLTRWTATNTTTILTGSPQRYVQRNARVLSTESIVYEGDAGLSTATTLEYDTDVNNFGSPQNVVKAKQYDYKVVSRDAAMTPGQSPPTGIIDVGDPTVSNTLLKIAETTYLQSDSSYNQSAYLANNLVKLVIGTKLRKPDNQIVAQTEIKYDETNYGNGYRGQATTVKSWLDPNNIWLEVRSKYDTYGNAIEMTDAKGNVSTTEYSATYNYAFPTKVTTPVPDSSGINGSQTSFQTTMTYNAITGLPLTVTDVNGQISTMEYEDSLLRPTKSIAPNGHQTITEYGAGTSEATRFVKVRSQIDEVNWKEGYSWYDGLGRTVKTQSVDSNGDVFTETEYDNMSRTKRATNSYRTGDTKLWTESVFDTAGRSWKIITPDGAFVETIYGLATSGANIGTSVTVKDQALKERRSITNGLGQLTRVDEPTDSGLGAINSPNQPTAYGYDILNNLTQVQQIGTTTQQCGGTVSYCSQTRSFVYDSLSRLKTATNPEFGTIQYSYDVNSNMTSKTDARGITTTYAYDALNRIKIRNYSDGITSNVTYKYDNLTNAKGKLIESDNTFSKTKYLSFDIMGRLTSSQQITDGTTYNPMTYTYNLSGALIEETYPSGRVVKNTLDVDGSLQQVQSRKINDTFKNYANSFNYTAAGAVSSMRLGNGRWENMQFNSRLQPTQIGLGASAGNQSLLKLNYDYGTTDNNGNIKSQTITVPNVGNNQGFTATQNYTYDSLNRLKQADEKPFGYTQAQCDQNPTYCWKQTFQYDRYGNRRFDQANTTFPTFANTNITNPTIDPMNNRFTTGQGYIYDLNGNLLTDAEGRSFVYDAENKQNTVSTSGGVIGQYFYDGDGKRVKKYVPTSGEITIFVYDASSRMVAEYSTIIEPQATAKISYLTTDHLGSPRIITDQNGVVVSRRDFLPFGEEVSSAQRTSNLNYTADNIREKFATYERDKETDIDYAKNRYFNSDFGRFSSPDPVLESAKINSPQSWNRYAYVENNPLKYIDPLGLWRVAYYKRPLAKLNFGSAAFVVVDSRKQIKS